MNKNLKIFQHNVEGVGTFCLRFPTVKDSIEIARLRAQKYLYGIRYEWDDEAKKDYPLGIDTTSLYMATAFCELITCTDKLPDGFVYDECDDLAMILDLYEAFYKWRLDFREGKGTSTDPTGDEKTVK